jgi:outer membrane protein assembly factor BamD (BamD/ComL family)
MKRICMPQAAAFAAIAFVGLACLGCASQPKPIPADLGSSELVQRAQEASDGYNYDQAIAYYQAVLNRFGEDPSLVCMGRYEIAFIYYKQGKYQASNELFTKLLASYDAEGGDQLPPRYKILAEKVQPKVQAGLSASKKK